MVAVITGASSGIGRDMARILSEKGYDLVIVARREDKLKELAGLLKTRCYVVALDLEKEENCYKLYEYTKEMPVEVLVNGAGFGLFGEFNESNLERELEMINVNIRSLHILTKLYLRDFRLRKRGYIMNIASSAGFMTGPLFSTYYATKNYVLRLTQAIFEEERRKKSGVIATALCPGPVSTEFSDVANVKFAAKPLSSSYVARCGIEGLFAGKSVIIPGITMKVALLLNRFAPEGIRRRIMYNVQSRKDSNN